MTNDSIISYPSNFLSDINITIVFKENENYDTLKKQFETYGYGFLIPNIKTIILDGEVFLGDQGLTFDDMKFVEAHEIAHILLGHDGPRNEQDELEADLGAYKILKKHNLKKSIDRLIEQFENRHGIKFDESLLEIIE